MVAVTENPHHEGATERIAAYFTEDQVWQMYKNCTSYSSRLRAVTGTKRVNGGYVNDCAGAIRDCLLFPYSKILTMNTALLFVALKRLLPCLSIFITCPTLARQGISWTGPVSVNADLVKRGIDNSYR